MVIDTSAVLAWLKNEPERERVVAALEAHPVCRISAVSLLEAHIVVRGREHPAMVDKLQRFLEEAGAVVMPFDERQARITDMAFGTERFFLTFWHFAVGSANQLSPPSQRRKAPWWSVLAPELKAYRRRHSS